MKEGTVTRVENIRRKVKMAKFHRDQLSNLRLVWAELEETEILIRTAALLEGCLHSLHHCLDLLGHAIAEENPGLMKSDGFYFGEVVGRLPPGVLRTKCNDLRKHDETQWLIGFVNYSKHHNLMRLSKVELVGSSGVSVAAHGLAGTGTIPLDVFVNSFQYKGKRMEPSFAWSAADFYCDFMSFSLEEIITELE